MKSHLIYAISKRTPVSAKAWKDIESIQHALNRDLTWSSERLSLAREAGATRPSFAFPFALTAARTSFAPNFRDHVEEALPRIPDSVASGSTRVRGDLWNAHCVVSFLKTISERHPELLIELRDEGGFVLPGAVWVKDGKVEVQREWLNRQRIHALETSGDIEAALPYIWAEHEALEGRFFADTSAVEFAEVPEIKELDMDWNELASVRLEELAERVVTRLAGAALVPVAA